MIGVFYYGNIVIAVDLFSQKKTARRGGMLDPTKPLKPQLYKALSGNKWDEFMEKFDREWSSKLSQHDGDNEEVV